MFSRLIRFAISLVLLCLLGLPGASTPGQAQTPGLVLAFYYAWYDQNTWTSGTTTDQPLELYVSAERATIERHVAQAQSAGIDALVQAWYGPAGEFNQTEANLQTLLDVGAGRGFRAAVEFETYSPFLNSTDDVVNALNHLLSVHAAHSAYLRVDGRPLVFFWAQNRYTPGQWADIRAQVDPNHTSIWIAEGGSPEYLGVFDGLYLYNVAWSYDLASTASRWATAVREASQTAGVYKYWVGTAMPGWNDSLVPGRQGSFVRERAGGAFYAETWTGAVSSQPDMVVITSFNEWPEGSTIEPSVSYGNTYLDLTAACAAGYKNAAGQGWPIPPTSEPVAMPTPTPTEPPTATDTPPPTHTATAVPATLTPSATLTPTQAVVETDWQSVSAAPMVVLTAPAVVTISAAAQITVSPTIAAESRATASATPKLPATSTAVAVAARATSAATSPTPQRDSQPSVIEHVLAGSPLKAALSAVLAVLLVVILWQDRHGRDVR